MYPLLITKTPSHRKDEVVTHVRLHTHILPTPVTWTTNTHVSTTSGVRNDHHRHHYTIYICMYTFVFYSPRPSSFP